MNDIDALKAAGLTNKRLKDIMTAEPPERPRKTTRQRAEAREKGADTTDTPLGATNRLETLPDNPTDWDIRSYLETVIRGEILEGMGRCADNFNRVGAMDLAYASIPIHPTTLPLMRVAMGHISLETCAANIAKLSTETRDAIFRKDARGRVTGVNRPKLLEVSHNLVHSLTTRRVAALATEVYQQYPLIKYDPYSNTQTGRLVGDCMTQLAEQMAGAYGYRKDYEESIRQASLYTDCIKFKKKAWHTEYQTLPKAPPKTGAIKTGKPAKKEFERRIVREGVLFTIPHPTRRSYDISEPLSKLNQDLGPRWINHWEVVPVGTVKHDKAYWNRDKIVMDAELYSIFDAHPAYFSQYYSETINQPRPSITAAALAQKNDRVAQIGAFAQLHDEVATILTQHYKRVIPKDIGIGTYEDPVWIRFVMAGHTTCVYAEICGSMPASVNSYNATDGLINSPSFGMQAIQWQEMLTNQLNQLRHVQAQGLVRIFCLNKHGMKKDEIEAVVNALKNPDFENLQDIVIEYDAEKLKQRGTDIQTITEKITQIRIETASKVTEIFNDMMNTLALAERIMFISPQELGQVSQRTTSATEQKAIRDTTLGIRDFHLIGLKQQIDADKRIIHGSYMAFGSDDLEVPIAERYDEKVIEAAGFEIVDDGTGAPPDGLYTIRGKKLGLLYNYTYTTRNTDDTPPDAVVAQGIAQVYEVVSKDPVLSEQTTLEQRMDLANSLFDKIAPGIFKLRVQPGVDGKKTQGGQVDAMQKQLGQILPQIGQAIQEMQQRQTATDQAITGLSQALTGLSNAISQIAKEPAPPANGKGLRTPPTRRGQVDPSTPIGAGAPPLRGVTQPRGVPALVETTSTTTPKMTTTPAAPAAGATTDPATTPKKIETVPSDIRNRVLGRRVVELTPDETASKKKADDEAAAAAKKTADELAAAEAARNAPPVTKVKKVKAVPPLPAAPDPAKPDDLRNAVRDVLKENAPEPKTPPKLAPELEREIELAKFAEKEGGAAYAGFADKLVAFYQGNDQHIAEKAKELGGQHTPEFKEYLQSDDYKQFVEQSRPSYQRGDKTRFQEAVIEHRAKESARREYEPKQRELERKILEVEHAPTIQKNANYFAEVVVTDVREDKKEEALVEYKKDPAKFAEQFPEEAQIIEEERTNLQTLAREVYRIDVGITQTDPNNPLHQRVRSSMLKINEQMAKLNPDGLEMEDGKILVDAKTYLERGLDKDARYRTWTAHEIAGMLAAEHNGRLISRLEKRREGMEKSFFVKKTAAPAAAAATQGPAKPADTPRSPEAVVRSAHGSARKEEPGTKSLARKYA